MKFFMVSQFGDGAHTLHVIKQEGNDVQLYIANEGYRTMWDGLLPKAKKIAPPEGAIVIFDSTGMGSVADQLRKSGFSVVGGSKWADRLEQDRKFGFDVMESAGIRVPLTAEFMDFSDVGSFLDENEHDEDGEERRFVAKFSGKDLPTHLTYCSEDRGDLEEWLKHVEKDYGKRIDSFILQEFVEGAEVSSELWFDGTKVLRPSNHTVEAKALMDGDLGPKTGCAGNLVWIDDVMCRIVNAGVGRVKDAAVGAGYVGPIDLNAIVNHEGVWGLEWTPRLGYDSWPSLMFLMRQEVGKFFSDLALGQLDRVPVDDDKFSAGIRISIPPYPLDPKKIKDVQRVHPNIGIPIRGLNDRNAGSFYFYEVKDDEGYICHSEGIGAVGVAIGVSDDKYSAFHKAYHALGEVKIPEKQYRTDLTDKLCDMHWHAEHQDNVSIGYIEQAVEVEGVG